MNSVFSLRSTGHVLVVLSSYDPPSATMDRRALWNEWFPQLPGLKLMP